MAPKEQYYNPDKNPCFISATTVCLQIPGLFCKAQGLLDLRQSRGFRYYRRHRDHNTNILVITYGINYSYLRDIG